MQQEVGEYLGGCKEAEAFSGGIITEGCDIADLLLGAFADVGFSGEVSSEPSVGVFDAALFPGAMGIAEIGFDADLGLEFVMQGELCAVVLGEGSAQLFRQRGEPFFQLPFGWLCLSAGWFGDADEAGGSFLRDLLWKIH